MDLSSPEHYDVIIVGAGLSGIGAACQLRQHCPEKTFAILEARDAIGGTWDLFRYPGIRSDSDMFTLGYSFAPWRDTAQLADGPSIRNYIVDTAREYGVEGAIRFGHRVLRADWRSETATWTLEVEQRASGETVSLTCRFLHICSGYYHYEEPFTPTFEGIERFQGEVIHPQHWPEDLDYAGKRVVVVGSGATAVTLVPAMAERAGHVTMLQRSPTYIVSLPGRDPVVRLLRRLLPDRFVWPVVRWKNVLRMMFAYGVSKRWPKLVKAVIRKENQRHLPAGFDVEKHFTPRYDPWDQRLCVVPNGDLFQAIRSGRASIATDTIETFTERGLRLGSGEELEADIVITATGLNLQILGGIEGTVDGRAINPADTVGYKGMMFSGVPNLAADLGYTNASWTLKCDLVNHYVCRLLKYMDEHGYVRAMPVEPPADVQREPFLDLKSGYIERALDRLPKQGSRYPWRLNQNYLLDIRLLKLGDLDDEGIEFSAAQPATLPEPALAA